MKEVEQFITEGGSYRAGVALLRQYNRDRALVVHLEQYITRNFAPREAETQLIDALSALLLNAPKPPLVNPSSAKPLSETPDHPLIALLKSDARQWADQRRALSLSLESCKDDAARYEVALQIRALSQRLDAAWTQITDYDTKGILPATNEETSTTAEAPTRAALLLEQLSIRPRLSKIKTLLSDDTLGATRRAILLSEQTQKNERLKIIEAQLLNAKNIQP